MLDSLVNFAKTIKNFLGFSALIVLASISIFMWAFTKGAFDSIIGNIKILSANQFFWIILIFLSMIFIVIICLLFLSYKYELVHDEGDYRLSVIVHNYGDETDGIDNALVVLSLKPKIRKEITDELGNAVFFFPKSYRGKTCIINARKEGFQTRIPKEINLQNDKQIFISLKTDIKQHEERILFKTYEIENQEFLFTSKPWPFSTHEKGEDKVSLYTPNSERSQIVPCDSFHSNYFTIAADKISIGFLIKNLNKNEIYLA